MLLHTRNKLISRACAILMGACFLLYSTVALHPVTPVEASSDSVAANPDPSQNTVSSGLELKVDVKIDVFTNLKYEYDILVYSADLKTCYGHTPCNVRPGETVNISINPTGPDYGLRYFYDFPTGVDGDFYTAVVPESGHITIELEPYDTGADIYGYVTDIDGEPISGATVSVTMSAYGNTSQSVLTDSFGSYKLSNISDRDDATLIVSREGYLSSVTTLDAMELRSSSLLKHNIQLSERTPAFRIRLINKWDDPRLAALLFDDIAEDPHSSLSVITSDGSVSDCERTSEQLNSIQFLPMRESDYSETYRISCQSRYFTLNSRSVRHGGSIEVTSQPVGAVSLRSTAADPYSDIFCCLYDMTGQLSAYRRVDHGSTDILLDPGYYTLVLYSTGRGLSEPYSTYDEMEKGLRNCYCMSVSVEDGHITDLGTLEAPDAVYTYDPYMISLEGRGTSAPVTISAPASTATGLIVCEGTAPAYEQVSIYDSGSIICTTQADQLGYWSACLSLASTPYPLGTHVLSAGITGTASEALRVLYDPSIAAVCDIYPISDGVRMSTSYTLSSDTKLAFEALLENYSLIDGTPSFTVLCSDGTVLSLEAHLCSSSYSAAGVYVATYASEEYDFGTDALKPVKVWFEQNSSNTAGHQSNLSTDMPSVIRTSGKRVTGLSSTVSDSTAFTAMRSTGALYSTIDDSDEQTAYESCISYDGTVLTVIVHSIYDDSYHRYVISSGTDDSDQPAPGSVSALDPGSLRTSGLTLAEMNSLLAALNDAIYISGSGDIRLTTSAISAIASAVDSISTAYAQCETLMSHAALAQTMIDAIEYKPSSVTGLDADELSDIICANITGEYEYTEICYHRALSLFSEAVRAFMLATDLSLDSLTALLSSGPDDQSLYNLAQTLYTLALADSFGTSLHPITPAIGVIYEAVASNRIPAATVTLYRYSSEDHFETFSHIDPYITGVDGSYGWTLIDGDYYVKAILPGYRAGSSQNCSSAVDVIDGINYIPADRMSDVNVAVTSTSPAHATIRCENGSLTLEFDRYVILDTVNRSNISFRMNGHRISTFVLDKPDDFVPGFLSTAVLVPLNAEQSPATTPLCGSKLLASRFSLSFPDGFGPNDILSVAIGEGLLTYNNLSAAGSLEINVPDSSEITDPVFLETASNSHMPIWMIASIILIVLILGGTAFYIYTHRKNF